MVTPHVAVTIDGIAVPLDERTSRIVASVVAPQTVARLRESPTGTLTIHWRHQSVRYVFVSTPVPVLHG